LRAKATPDKSRRVTDAIALGPCVLFYRGYSIDPDRYVRPARWNSLRGIEKAEVFLTSLP